jgi:hypothetical protein
MNRVFKLLVLFVFLVGSLSGCVYLSGSKRHPFTVQPEMRISATADQLRFGDYKIVGVLPALNYTIRRYEVGSGYGDITIDYFELRGQKSPELILIFPILGGKNKFENYFADVLARAGFESAIIHRNDEFKNPALFAQIEAVMRRNTLRDMVALNFFEKVLGKCLFGGFGLSRGAMNLVITAGSDPRLKYNFLALGCASISKVVRTSKEWRIKAYIEELARVRHSTVERTLAFLEKTLISEPYVFAPVLDPQNTMLVLGALDSTVPFAEGLRLRKFLGNPATVYLLSGHATSLLYSRFFRLLSFGSAHPVLPLPYLETEIVNFFTEKMRPADTRIGIIPFRIFQTPGNIAAELLAVLMRE